MSAQSGWPRALLLRHGETEWSSSGRHTSRTDIPLTERGRDQARAAGRGLAAWHFEAVLCSPRSRARETAALAGLAVTEICDDLREWEYGDDEGLTTSEIRRRRPGWVLWDDGCPGGEGAADVAARVDRVLDAVRQGSGDVALVAHGHLLRVLAARWLGFPGSAGRHLALGTGTICVLGWEHDEPTIERWNAAA